MKDKIIIIFIVASILILGWTLVQNLTSEKKEPVAIEEAMDAPEVQATTVAKLQDGDIFEMKAEIVQQSVGNRIIKRLAYNRQIPGPIIEAEKGATVTIRLTNLLDIPTTLHSHGVRLESTFDGVPEEMGGVQKPIEPGETFSYTITFPDAGVFWYHPHMREDYTQEMGLYGNYSVQEKAYWNSVDQEEFLVLDDFSENDPFYADSINKTLMGRYGNLLLINNEEDYSLTVTTGAVTRFFLTNTANVRPFLLTIPGATIKLVGGDIGRIERETFVSSIVLAPAERAVVEVRFDTPGTYPILHRGKEMGRIIAEGKNVLSRDDFSVLRENKSDYALLRHDFTKWLTKKSDKKLRASIEMSGMGGGMMMNHGAEHQGTKTEESGIEWEDTMAMMNEMSNDENVTWQLIDEETKKVNEDMSADWQFMEGDMVKIQIYNDPNSAHPMQHPIHFHGQRFVILSRDGKPNDNLQWKDTALIRTGETVEILVEMSNPGHWMAHCHIAEHMHSGMMFGFSVHAQK